MPSLAAKERSFGTSLRYWRGLRHVSQLDLALAADVSSRHVSFLETGRAKPSPEMVSRLADALSLPLRERNALLLAAGFAPGYAERPLTSPELSQARQAIDLVLRYHDPYPAFVLSRHWDLVMRNRASERVFGWLLQGRARDPNIMRQVFSDDGLRPLIVNWDEVARDMLQHLNGQSVQAPDDSVLAALRSEILASRDMPSPVAESLQAPAPLLTAVYARDGRELRFFSTLSTFGAPYDITLEELRIECMFPGDGPTAAFCRELAVLMP
jgi:transcriptional regulator with XRE-family HTH domain